MMTLRDLFEVFYTITDVSITAYDPEYKFIHKWEYGPGVLERETIHQYHERIDGRLTLVDEKINSHGDATRGGSEIGWGVKTKLFPKEILDARIWSMSAYSRKAGEEHHVIVNIEIPELTAMTIIPKEEIAVVMDGEEDTDE